MATSDKGSRNFTYLEDANSPGGCALRRNLVDLCSSITGEKLKRILEHLLQNNVLTNLEMQSISIDQSTDKQSVSEVVSKFITKLLFKKFETDFPKIVNAIRSVELHVMADQIEKDAKTSTGKTEDHIDGKNFSYKDDTPSYLRQSVQPFIKDIYQDIGVDWINVGVYLDVDYEKLKKIEVENSTVDGRSLAMLNYWQRSNASKAYTGYLVDVLKEAKLVNVAEELISLCMQAES